MVSMQRIYTVVLAHGCQYFRKRIGITILFYPSYKWRNWGTRWLRAEFSRESTVVFIIQIENLEAQFSELIIESFDFS